jgi:hippurate hydrolase
VLVPPVMGGEDFGRYGPAADAPGYLMWLGACERGLWDEAQKEGAAALPGLHTKDFAPDPLPAIATGVEAMCAAVISLLPV